MIRSDMNDSARRFPSADPFLRALDAMTDSISNQVSEGLRDCVQQALIEIGILPSQDEVHVLAASLCHVAHHARKATEKLLYRNHADFHDRALQIVQHAGLKCHGITKAAA